jgi:hypothetical protein
MPALNISGRLSYTHAKHLFNSRHSKKKNYKPVHNSTNYSIRQRGDAYVLRMYNTDILVFHPDGSIYCDGYDSMTTRQVMNDYGPVRMWSNAQVRFCCKYRFDNCRSRYYGYPVNNGFTIDPTGFVHGLVDRVRIIDPSTRAERTQLAKQFRDKAIARVCLGEFGALAKRENDEWHAYVPSETYRVAELLLQEADHNAINYQLDLGLRAISVGFYRRHAEKRVYATQDEAYHAVMNSLQRALLNWGSQYVYKKIHYEPVQVL